ncbi:MAG: hypothetical protein IT376_19260 [Polyangiaceae bacterium]|nr:hypothetical protein [Polyangiaceae bacterium]
MTRALARRSALPAALLAALLGAASPCLGQTDEERSGARAAAEAAAKAFEGQRWQEAIDLFAKAEKLVHAPTHLLFLARSHQKLGQLVKAREAYRKVVSETLPANAPKAFKAAQAAAEKELAELEPRIPQLTVRVEGATGEVTLKIDGVASPAALVGVAFPIDPGEHELVAETPGEQSEPKRLTIAEKSREEVTLVLAPRATPAAKSDSGAADAPAAGGDARVDTASAEPKLLAWGAVGVGVVGVGVGTFFLVQASGKLSESDDLCSGGGVCPESRRQRIDQLDADANTASTIGLVGLGVGAVGLGLGAWWLFGAAEPAAPGQARVTPWIGPGSAGVRGTF